MSKSDKKERKRRRRAQSAINHEAQSDDILDTRRYTKRLEERLRKAELTDDGGKPIVAMQVRHINNRQHAIPFRQQFIEQMVQDIQDIDRKVNADRRKQAEENDKKNAHLRRQLEDVHQKKVRELELYNNRDLVQKLLEDHLMKSTPQDQLRRINQLEEELRQMRKEYDELVRRVVRNETKYNEDKQEHDEDINGMKKRFDDYKTEINEYKRKTDKIIADLEARLKSLHEEQELLNRTQEGHGISIKDLSLQRETLNKLSQQIEQIINTRRSDLDKLDKFTTRLDEIMNLLNRVQEGLYPLARIPSLEREIEEIRNLLIEPNTLEELKSRISQIQRDIIRHNEEFEQFNGRLGTFDSLYQGLQQRIDDIKNNDLSTIRQHLASIDNDLKRKSSEIDQANASANRANDLINELRGLLQIIDQRLSDLDNKISDIENIKFRLNRLETKPDDLRIAQILDEQNQIRALIQDLINKGQQLNDLITDVENLKNMMNMLSKPIITNNDDLKQKALEDYLKEMARQLLESVSTLKQQLIEQINEAKSLINLLKAKLDELLYVQQQTPSETPPNTQLEAPPLRKLIPFVEPVKSVDLLQNIWT